MPFIPQGQATEALAYRVLLALTTCDGDRSFRAVMACFQKQTLGRTVSLKQFSFNRESHDFEHRRCESLQSSHLWGNGHHEYGRYKNIRAASWYVLSHFSFS